MKIVLPLILFTITVFKKRSMTFLRQVTKDDRSTVSVVIKQEGGSFLIFSLRPEVQDYVLEQIYRQQSTLGTDPQFLRCFHDHKMRNPLPSFLYKKKTIVNF